MSRQMLDIPEYLDMELLARLPSLELQARFLVEGLYTGDHRSPLRGFNIEFKDFRNYQSGDEPRTIDWKVYARTGRLHVKVREEDTNLTAYFLVDATGSMNFKSTRAEMTKWQYARSLAAAMLLLCNRQHDSPSIAVFGDGGWQHVKPSLKASDQHRMLSALSCRPGGNGVPLSASLAKLAPMVRRRSIVFVLSDFYESPDALDPALRRMRRDGSEAVFLHVMDPAELEFDFEVPVLLEEPEEGKRITVSPDLVIKEYMKKLGAHCDALKDTVRKYGGEYCLVRTDQLPHQVLGAYLAGRSL